MIPYSSKASCSRVIEEGKLELLDGGGGEEKEQVQEKALEGGESLIDRTGKGEHIESGDGEEEKEGEGEAMQVKEERLEQGKELGQNGRGGQSGMDDFVGEDLSGL